MIAFETAVTRPVAYSNWSRMTLLELRSRYRNQILALAERRGTHNVRVFGSIARDEQRSGSDIDFLVDFEPGRSLLDLTGLLLDLEAVLGCKVDVVSSRGLKPRLASEVLRDAIAL
jgi:uncharacterized protein